MLFADMASASERVRATRSRKEKVAALAEALGAAGRDELPIVASYLSGDLPQGRLGVGWGVLSSVDAPAAAEPSLTVSDVDSALDEIGAQSGPGSEAQRRELLTDLLSRATPDEQALLGGLVRGEVRQGALAGLMADAIASAFEVEPALVRRAAMLAGSLPEVAAAAAGGGIEAVREIGLALFRPVQPMLASTAPSVEAALESVEDASVEWKIDGARVQIHKDGERVAIFTRNLRDVTEQVPGLARLAASLPIDRAILDGEAIALDRDGRPLAFQETMSRFSASGDGDLTLFLFDVLHLDGIDLIDLPGAKRWTALEGPLSAHAIRRLLNPDPVYAQDFFDEAIAAGHEGVMVKALDAPYEAGRRGKGWLKVKPVHTLDLVVLAVEWGSGRRKGWLSNLHLGARDPDGGLVMLGKTFKGLTDEMLEWQTERFLGLETHREGHVVHVRPEQVVEIAFDGVQASRRYPGGMALRFARVKGYRSDKDPSEADTIGAVREIFGG
jgi:DNA ligase-1